MEYDEVDIIMSDLETVTKEEVPSKSPSTSVSSKSHQKSDEVDAKSMGIIR